jgi:hypothetical protein
MVGFTKRNLFTVKSHLEGIRTSNMATFFGRNRNTPKVILPTVQFVDMMPLDLGDFSHPSTAHSAPKNLVRVNLSQI